MRFSRIDGVLDWKRSLAELSLIIVGVLIALGANSWWESRKDRERERAYLQQLLSDVCENGRRLERTIANDSTSTALMGHFSDAASTAEALWPTDSLMYWTRGFGWDDLEALTGTYASLVQSGDIRLIRTDSVRAAVIAYAAEMTAARESMGRKAAEMWRIRERLLPLRARIRRLGQDSVDVEAMLRDGGIGETLWLTASVHYSSGHVVSGCPASWTSDGEDVAVVDDEGVVTAVAHGHATITATVGGVSGAAEISVESAGR